MTVEPRGAIQKKLTFLADMSAKALSPPPPLCLTGHINKNGSFCFLNKKGLKRMIL